jgi:hypothetical protein
MVLDTALLPGVAAAFAAAVAPQTSAKVEAG